MAQRPDLDSPIARWWQSTDDATRERFRAADYFEATPLPVELAGRLLNAGVTPLSASVGGPPHRLDDWHLTDADVDTLRALDGAPPEP